MVKRISLKAIEWFYSTAKKTPIDCHYMQERTEEISVDITFEGVQLGLSAMRNERNKTTLSNILGDNDSVIVRKTSETNSRKFIINGEEISTGTGFSSALNDFLPKLEYVSTKIKLDDVSSYRSKSPIGLMLTGVLTAIIEEDEQYIEFKNVFSKLFEDKDSNVRLELDRLGKSVEIYLQKQFPNGTSIKFNVETPIFEDLLKKFETTVDDGVRTKAEEKGDGMQRAIMLSIIQAYAEFRKSRNIATRFIFLIDEAELHLHPSGQRALKQALLDVSNNGDQVFINTHSSVLVADEQDGQTTFKVEKIERNTTITSVNEDEKSYVIYELLGGSPSDLLLPKNFIITEGKSEYEFLKKVTQKFYPSFSGIQILWGGGDTIEQERSLHGVHKVFNPIAIAPNPVFKKKAVVICDKPSDRRQEKKFQQFTEGYPYLEEGNQLFVLPTSSLEEYYPNTWKATPSEIEGQPGGKKAYAIKVGSEITKEEFENNMPILFQAIQSAINNSF